MSIIFVLFSFETNVVMSNKYFFMRQISRFYWKTFTRYRFRIRFFLHWKSTDKNRIHSTILREILNCLSGIPALILQQNRKGWMGWQRWDRKYSFPILNFTTVPKVYEISMSSWQNGWKETSRKMEGEWKERTNYKFLCKHCW